MKKYKVKLLKTHTHEGVERQVGDLIEVTKLEALFLFKQQVIDKLPIKLGAADEAAEGVQNGD